MPRVMSVVWHVSI